MAQSSMLPIDRISRETARAILLGHRGPIQLLRASSAPSRQLLIRLLQEERPCEENRAVMNVTPRQFRKLKHRTLQQGQSTIRGPRAAITHDSILRIA